MFFDRGTFWALPLTYFYLPESARAYLFRSKLITFAAAPSVLTPFVRNQNQDGARPAAARRDRGELPEVRRRPEGPRDVISFLNVVLFIIIIIIIVNNINEHYF